MTNDVIVIGAGSHSGLVRLIYGDDLMFGRVVTYDRGLDARDAKIAKLRSRLSLAHASRNKPEVTRLTRELKYLGQSW